MKNLKKIIFSIIIIMGMHANATTLEINKECLIEEMSENDNVISFIDHNIIINMSVASGIKTKKDISKEILAKFNKLNESHKELKKNVDNEFPSYKKMSQDEQTEVLMAIADRSQAKLNFWTCTRAAFLASLVCAGVTGAVWATAKYWICVSTVAIADAASGLDPVLIAASEAANVLCLRVAAGVSAVIATSCTGTLIETLYGCI